MLNAGSSLRILKNKSEVMRADLVSPQILIGRSPVCDIVLRAKSVAPIHFLIERQVVPLFEDSTTELWLLFDISAHQMRSMGQGSEIGSAAGIVLDEQPRELAGFEFNLHYDRLAPTVLREGAFRKGVEKRAHEQNRVFEYQGAFINAVECLLYEKQANAIVSLVHLPIGKRPVRKRPFPQLKEVAITTLPQNEWLAKVDIKPELAFTLRNKGLIPDEPGVGLPPEGAEPRSFCVGKTDFLELETERYTLFLRGIIFERLSLEKKPRFNHTAALFLIGLVLFMIATASIVNQVRDEVKPEPRRVVRLERTKAPPAPVKAAKPPSGKTAAMAPSEAASSDLPHVQQATQDWTKLVDKLKASRAREGVSVAETSKSVRTGQSRDGRSGPTRRAFKGGELPGGPPRASDDFAKSAGALSAPELGVARGQGRRARGGGALEGVQTPVQLEGLSGASAALNGAGTTQGFGVRGGLSRQQVQAGINRYRGEIRSCYEKQLISSPTLKGRVVSEWTVRPDGSVQGARIVESSLRSPEVESCIRRVIEAMRFPTASSQVATKVRYPLFLAPL